MKKCTERPVTSTYGAVAERNGTSKLNHVTSGDGRVQTQEMDQVVDRVVNTSVSLESGLDRREDEHGTVGTTATESLIRCEALSRASTTYAARPWERLMEMASWKVSRKTSWAGPW